MEDDPRSDEGKRPKPNPMAAGIAIGAGAGAVLFAATQNPVWIGVFAGIGVAIGAALQSGDRR
jgi:uncharacterized membrane protein